MKKTCKRLLSLIIAFVLVFGCFTALPNTDMKVSAAGGVKAKLDAFMQSYPSGSRWTGSFDGGIQCYGFAKLVVYNIFGGSTVSGKTYRSWFYDGTSTSGMNIVGSTTSFSSTNVRNLLANAKCGDILQFAYTKQHSMIVYAVESDGVWIYDCNWDGNCGISLRKCSFGTWDGRNSAKLTLLRSDNYASVDGTNDSNIVPYMDMWFSGTEYGTSSTQFTAQNRVYLCYEIKDRNTDRLFNSLVSNVSYNVTVTIYNPDGSVAHTNQVARDDASWISIVPTQAGTYTGVVSVTGDIYGDYTRTFSLTYNAQLLSSHSSISLNLTGTNTANITYTPAGGYPGSKGASWDYDSSVVEVTDSFWSDGVFTLSIRGLKLGSTNLVVNLYENYTDSKTVVATKTIPITVTSSITSLSVNSINSAIISNGGQMSYYTYTPTTSGKYVIYSTGSSDTKVYLYNSSLTELDSDDDDGDSTNFRLEYNLTAGTKYIFGIKYYNSSTTGTIPFTFGRVYTITYNANDGSGTPASQSKDYAQNITLSSTIPTRSGYTFKGWSTSSSATTATYQPGATFSTNSNTTLYAVWQLAPTALTVNSSTSSTISTGGAMKYYTYTPSTTAKYVIYSTGPIDTKVYLYNANLSEITSDDDSGEGYNFRLEYNLTAGTQYIFGVKFYDSSTTGIFPFTFGRVYTITYNANGGSGTPASQSKDYAQSITLSSVAPTRVGYTFKGWATSSSATTATYQPGATFSTNSNTTLYAVWQAISYTVTFKDWDGTTLKTQTVNYGGSATAPSSPSRTGYTFTGWNKSFSNITANTTVTATYSKNAENVTARTTFTVTLTDNGNGTAHISARLPKGIAAGKLIIETSDKLDYVTGSLRSEYGFVNDSSAAGKFIVTFAKSTVFAEGTVILEADFRIVGNNLSVDDFTAPTWELSDGNTLCASQDDGNVIKVFEKRDGALGDVNSDGRVNSLDAAQILKYDALLIELSEMALTAADVNGDGRVNSLDAAMILKYDAGIIDSFN